ncbi:unnamed protein product [Symbiodinium pilosum]|uniref:Uncharacterized protein n=1 Tax=Symbiodinium pilosum TaxID=2952 RepID=A0A812WQE8_SYMPI|nr:unnamed protein product [Symbiodinium pilosum]
MAGRWISTTCANHLSVQDAMWHEAVQSAHGNGSCSVDTLQRISWSRQCCKSYPANACNKVAKRMTPCRDEADFQPGKIRQNYCVLFDQPENASCTRHGCRWNNARCDCSDQEGCASLAGRWISNTCADYLSEQGAAWHKAVQLAHGNGSCSVDTLQHISWSQECCKSYPANACYKTLKRMTPCRDEADFRPDANNCSILLAERDPESYLCEIGFRVQGYYSQLWRIKWERIWRLNWKLRLFRGILDLSSQWRN